MVLVVSVSLIIFGCKEDEEKPEIVESNTSVVLNMLNSTDAGRGSVWNSPCKYNSDLDADEYSQLFILGTTGMSFLNITFESTDGSCSTMTKSSTDREFAINRISGDPANAIQELDMKMIRVARSAISPAEQKLSNDRTVWGYSDWHISSMKANATMAFPHYSKIYLDTSVTPNRLYFSPSSSSPDNREDLQSWGYEPSPSD